MSLFDIIAVLMTLAAVFGYMNHRWLKLDSSVGLLLISLAASLGIMALHWAFPHLQIVTSLQTWAGGIDFNEALMHGMLGFLLFAGALHVDLEYFALRKLSIASLATVGLLLSTFLVGTASYYLFQVLDMQVSYLACLVFGSLISPTDPIAVMGTLKTLNVPKELEAKIAGESLFNDGVAVVIFTGLVALLLSQAGGHEATAVIGQMDGNGAAHGASPGGMGSVDLAVLFVREAGGGALLGLLFGYLAYRLMLSIDDYKVEVMLTLALVMGAYSLAWALHVSGPIAVVVAGLLIGNRGRALAMSEEVVDYLEKFWELIDEILNALLFLLIGVEVLVVAFNAKGLLAGVILIAIVLLARFVSVWLPISLISLRRKFPRGVVRILTWAGLRGGISVALALSLPAIPEKSLILTCTYIACCGNSCNSVRSRGQQVEVGDVDEVIRPDFQRCHQAFGLGPAVVVVLALFQHDFQLEIGAEALDLVQMDARAPGHQQRPLLAHATQFAERHRQKRTQPVGIVGPMDGVGRGLGALGVGPVVEDEFGAGVGPGVDEFPQLQPAGWNAEEGVGLTQQIAWLVGQSLGQGAGACRIVHASLDLDVDGHGILSFGLCLGKCVRLDSSLESSTKGQLNAPRG